MSPRETAEKPYNSRMFHLYASLPIVLATMMATTAAQHASAAMIRVACVQMQVSNSVDTNTARIVEAIRTEAAQGTRVVVFPECALSGYDGRFVPNVPQSAIDAAVERIRAACRTHRVYAIVGTTWLADGIRRNVGLVVDPTGAIICNYAKMHVVEAYNANGDELAYFLVDGVPATLFICHDERYPELMRIPVLAGAKIAFYISFESQADSGKNFNYRCQIVGRAVENQTWVVSCNAPAANECGKSHGQSRIIAPDGTIRQEAGDGETVIREALDTDLSSNAWARSAALAPPFDQFWAESLRVLQSRHGDLLGGVTIQPKLLPDRGRPGNSHNRKLRMACVQSTPSDDLAANTERMIASIAEQAAAKARVVVFPERALTGGGTSLARVDPAAIDAAVNQLRQACREHRVYCVFGAAFQEDAHTYNGAYVISPAGEQIDRYAQLRPVAAGNFAAGSRLALFKLDGVYATVLIGHDLHFPEFSRIAALAGAKVCIYLACEQPARSVATTESMVVCRSVESQMFIVWCNAGTGSAKDEAGGHSRMVSPAGKILAEASEQAQASMLGEMDTTKASYNYPRAGASTPSLAAFWQEGLDLAWAQNPWLANETTQPKSAPASR